VDVGDGRQQERPASEESPSRATAFMLLPPGSPGLLTRQMTTASLLHGTERA